MGVDSSGDDILSLDNNNDEDEDEDGKGKEDEEELAEVLGREILVVMRSLEFQLVLLLGEEFLGVRHLLGGW